MRTTLDIAEPVLRQLKQLQSQTGKSLGDLASELLARALAGQARQDVPPFRWKAASMGALVDVSDKDALYRLLDSDR